MTKVRRLFDRHAPHYDANFSYTDLGRYYRERTHLVFDRFCTGGMEILELNAGTGEDALHLARLGNRVLATDISPGMLEVVEKKVRAQNLGRHIAVRQLDLMELHGIGGGGFDCIVSNFGGLNCVNDWRGIARQSRRVLRENGLAIFCLMGPMVPWEWIWFSLRGEFSSALRRVSGTCNWRGARIYYPRMGRFESMMASESLHVVYREALGVFMPPPYVEGRVGGRARRYLETLENSVRSCKAACRLADHYLLVLQRG